jgi:chromosome segregation ATPase
LDTELADEQDRYQMLNETLVGQRRTLREREEILKQHQAVLQRRQGLAPEDGQDKSIDLGPVLTQIENQRQQQATELQKLESQIEQTRSAIEQAQGMINHQAGEQEQKRHELKQLEENLQIQKITVAELWGRVNTYQEMLQPIQDNLNGVREKLEAIAGMLAQFQETSDYQLQAIAQMRQILMTLMGNQAPELAAS